MLPSVPEQLEAQRLGGELGDRAIRERSFLRAHCNDCAGRVIMAVAMVDGRPLAALRELDDRHVLQRRDLGRHWSYAWFDRGYVLSARCLRQWHVLHYAELPADGDHGVFHRP